MFLSPTVETTVWGGLDIILSMILSFSPKLYLIFSLTLCCSLILSIIISIILSFYLSFCSVLCCSLCYHSIYHSIVLYIIISIILSFYLICSIFLSVSLSICNFRRKKILLFACTLCILALLISKCIIIINII